MVSSLFYRKMLERDEKQYKNKQTFLSFKVFYKRSMPAAKPEYTYYSMFVDARFEKVCHKD